jgi:hypothetical protein
VTSRNDAGHTDNIGLAARYAAFRPPISGTLRAELAEAVATARDPRVRAAALADADWQVRQAAEDLTT